jgi:hypothetical protein
MRLCLKRRGFLVVLFCGGGGGAASSSGGNKCRRIRRRQGTGLMEAKGGEVRRIHLIYFLSHMGRVEHPHLIRVHHFNRNGVYLRGDYSKPLA